MKHRAFGRTDIQVSEVVFGAGAVGGILIEGLYASDFGRPLL